MYVRATLILAALWSLALAPVLCGGGMLAHACDCPDEACGTGCGCVPDPCEQVVVWRDDDAAASPNPPIAPMPLCGAPSATQMGNEFPLLRLSADLPSPQACAIHSSDLPLLL